MSKKKIIPSRFYIVRRDTSVEQCLKIMNERSLSCLLVRDGLGKLVGIFTLKDLIRNFNYLRDAKYLKKAVGVLMSRPVKTLPLHHIHKAAEIMLKHSFRHLPVISDSKDEENRIIGVIDIESLLKNFIEQDQGEKLGEKFIAVYSPDGVLLKLLKNALKLYDLIEVDKLWASKLKMEMHIISTMKEYDLLFFDLMDEKSIDLALSFAMVVQGSKKIICALDTERLGSPGEQSKLRKLNKFSQVRIFEKPIAVHDIIYECLY